ncbi:MAG: hypothetical protein E6Q31_03755 [Aquabacterium sp.]|nr:MAG: hypothetical protein E6Q31_03755 [Aquabacterium sp.]
MAWVLLAAILLRLGPAIHAAAVPSLWALGLAMGSALAGHLWSRRLLWPPEAVHASPLSDTQRQADAQRLSDAVEQGRGEERLRIAQDLHDDIGARLLTLMYQAPTPEMGDYIRHTLQDLKTLTRGLAAPSHRLSDAAAEWKRDLSHRLELAHCALTWEMQADQDVDLSMVQWSALTRILRELVSNAICHARAEHVTVTLILAENMLTLRVSDDGQGQAPQQWAHGLGLSGVRKRVKQLNGEVRWFERDPVGICAEVWVPHFVGRPPAGQRSH